METHLELQLLLRRAQCLCYLPQNASRLLPAAQLGRLEVRAAVREADERIELFRAEGICKMGVVAAQRLKAGRKADQRDVAGESKAATHPAGD